MSIENNIPNGWVETTLGKIIDIKHGFAFKGQFISLEPNNNILVTPGNFKVGGGFKSDKFKYYSGDIPKDYILKPNDVIVTMTDLSKEGDTLGFSAKVPNGDSQYLHNQRIGLVEFINAEFDEEFIYWFLRTSHYQKSMVNSATGSTVRHTSPNRIKEYNFYCPQYQEQVAIAKILTTFDDKIELLQAQNKTLETTAQTLFKEWFGKYQIGDALPEGWRVGKLGEVVESTSGGTPSRKNDSFYINGKYNWVKSKELKGTFIIETEEKITEEALEKSSAKLFPSNSILIAMYGNTVGEYALVSKPMTCNQAVCALIPNEKIPFTYLFFLIKSLKIEFINNAIGSAQQNISQVLIKNTDIIYSELLISKFHSVSKPLMDKVLLNVEQIQTLKQTRDTLLPKLMSGQLRVDAFKEGSLC